MLVQWVTLSDLTLNLLLSYRVKALNSGSVLNVGNGPQSGPSMFNAAKGRKVAHHCLEKHISGI